MSDIAVPEPSVSVEQLADRKLVSGHATLVPWIKRNSLGVGIGIISIIGAMLFVFFEPLLISHRHIWLLSGAGDFWVQWRAAGLVPNPGGYSHIFYFDVALKTPPGWELLISPIAHRFLSWPFPLVPGGWGIAHPKAIWVAAPTELAAIPFCMCTVDVWLRRLGSSRGRRVLVLLTLAVLMPSASLWGHPEDLMALGCALLAMRAVRDDRWSAGWWMGAALAFQVEAILVLPLCLVLLNRRRIAFVVESLVLPLAVLAVPLIGDWRQTEYLLVHQVVFTDGIRYTPIHHIAANSATVVDFITLALAGGVAALVWRRRDRINDASVFWLVGLLYSVRLVYPSIYPYYLVPSLAVFCAASVISRPWRFGGTLMLGVFMAWWVQFAPVDGHVLYWISDCYPLIVMAFLSFPPQWLSSPSVADDAAARAELEPPPLASAVAQV